MPIIPGYMAQDEQTPAINTTKMPMPDYSETRKTFATVTDTALTLEKEHLEVKEKAQKADQLHQTAIAMSGAMVDINSSLTEDAKTLSADNVEDYLKNSDAKFKDIIDKHSANIKDPTAKQQFSDHLMVGMYPNFIGKLNENAAYVRGQKAQTTVETSVANMVSIYRSNKNPWDANRVIPFTQGYGQVMGAIEAIGKQYNLDISQMDKVRAYAKQQLISAELDARIAADPVRTKKELIGKLDEFQADRNIGYTELKAQLETGFEKSLYLLTTEQQNEYKKDPEGFMAARRKQLQEAHKSKLKEYDAETQEQLKPENFVKSKYGSVWANMGMPPETLQQWIDRADKAEKDLLEKQRKEQQEKAVIASYDAAIQKENEKNDALTQGTVPLVNFSTGPAYDGNKVVAFASTQVGVHESNGGHLQYTKGKNQPWCMDFISAAYEKSFGKTPWGNHESSVANVRKWAEKKGIFSKQYAGAAPGDLVIFGTGKEHVGIITKIEQDGTIHTIEGNSTDMVAQRTYKPGSKRVFGYVNVSRLDEIPSGIKATPAAIAAFNADISSGKSRQEAYVNMQEHMRAINTAKLQNDVSRSYTSLFSTGQIDGYVKNLEAKYNNASGANKLAIFEQLKLAKSEGQKRVKEMQSDPVAYVQKYFGPAKNAVNEEQRLRAVVAGQRALGITDNALIQLYTKAELHTMVQSINNEADLATKATKIDQLRQKTGAYFPQVFKAMASKGLDNNLVALSHVALAGPNAKDDYIKAVNMQHEKYSGGMSQLEQQLKIKSGGNAALIIQDIDRSVATKLKEWTAATSKQDPTVVNNTLGQVSLLAKYYYGTYGMDKNKAVERAAEVFINGRYDFEPSLGIKIPKIDIHGKDTHYNKDGIVKSLKDYRIDIKDNLMVPNIKLGANNKLNALMKPVQDKMFVQTINRNIRFVTTENDDGVYVQYIDDSIGKALPVYTKAGKPLKLKYSDLAAPLAESHGQTRSQSEILERRAHDAVTIKQRNQKPNPKADAWWDNYESTGGSAVARPY